MFGSNKKLIVRSVNLTSVAVDSGWRKWSWIKVRMKSYVSLVEEATRDKGSRI